MSCSASKSGVKKSVNDSLSEIPVEAEPSPAMRMSVLGRIVSYIADVKRMDGWIVETLEIVIDVSISVISLLPAASE